MRVTSEDRKNVSKFITLLLRNAYGGNMMSMEHALAKLLSEERERCAMKLEAWSATFSDEFGDNALYEAAKKLRGEEIQPELEEQPNV